MNELNKYSMETALIRFNDLTPPNKWNIQFVSSDTNLITKLDNQTFKLNRNGLYLFQISNANEVFNVSGASNLMFYYEHARIYNNDTVISYLHSLAIKNTTNLNMATFHYSTILPIEKEYNLNIRYAPQTYTFFNYTLDILIIKLQDSKLKNLEIIF